MRRVINTPLATKSAALCGVCVGLMFFAPRIVAAQQRLDRFVSPRVHGFLQTLAETPPENPPQRANQGSPLQRRVPLRAQPLPPPPNFASADLGSAQAPQPPSTVGPQRQAGTVSVAQRHLQQGIELATRGAFFSALAEFTDVLRLYTRDLDMQTAGRQRSEGLTRGLRAMEEAEDFIPRGSSLDTELDLPAIVESHRTPILRDQPLNQLLPTRARNQYYAYAVAQLAEALRGVPEASEGLYGLGRLYTAMSENPEVWEKTSSLRALAFHQAALSVNPRHSRAANELGVLLARHGQLEPARQALEHSVSLAPHAESYRNLAAVYQRLGRSDLAAQAMSQHQQLAQCPAPPSVSGKPYRYVSRQAFNQMSAAGAAAAAAASPNQGPPPPMPPRDVTADAAASWWEFWKH